MATDSKIAIITGANRGLGRSAALKLAQGGVDVIITYRSHAAEATAVVEGITAMGRKAVALQLDTGKVGTFEKFGADVRAALAEHWQRDAFDFLVNNAGLAVAAPIAEMTVDGFDELMDVHFKGVYFLTQKLLPLLADGGRIINLSSGLTRFVGAQYSAYASMKGAVEVFTRYLAAELGPRGITANVVAPGPTGTDFGGGAMRDDEQVRAALSGMAALGRVGEPDDIGGVVASLLTDGTGWITAQRIEASGGARL